MATKQIQKEHYLLSFKAGKRWLANITNDKTRSEYVLRLYRYCLETGLNPDQIVEEKAKSLQNPALRGLAEDRLKRWHAKASQKTPGNAINVFKVVRSFCKANYVPLSAKIPMFIAQRETVYVPKKTEVREMCDLANYELKTMILLLAESGRRIGTLSDLKYGNVREGLRTWKPSEPFSFSIPQKRNRFNKIVKSKRIYGKWGFACQDAKEALKLLIKTKGITNDEEKLFVCEPQTYSKAISDIAVKIGINPRHKGLKPFRAHNLRKMCQTCLEDANVPTNWVDRILGHKPRGAQGATYSLPSKEKLAKKYKMAMEALEIYETRSTSQPKVKELEKRISQLEAIVAKLA